MVSLSDSQLRCKCFARSKDREKQNIESDKEFLLHCARPCASVVLACHKFSSLSTTRIVHIEVKALF